MSPLLHPFCRNVVLLFLYSYDTEFFSRFLIKLTLYVQELTNCLRNCIHYSIELPYKR